MRLKLGGCVKILRINDGMDGWVAKDLSTYG